MRGANLRDRPRGFLRVFRPALALVCRAEEGTVTFTERAGQSRLRRSRVYGELFSARALCVAGLAAMPALLLNPDTKLRACQFLFFWFLAWLSGKKNNPAITVLVISAVTAFNLLVPYGRVIASAGAFRLTSGALEAGINRALTLEGLVMLSRASVRQDLRFPGLFGELIGESFRIFAGIIARKPRITGKGFVDSIDRLMIELSGDSGEAPLPCLPAPAARTKPAGFAVLAVALALSWLPWVAGFYCSSR